MIAMDIYEEERTDLARVYGAITIGEVWRFAVLEREEKHLIRDIHTFRFPEDLYDLRILPCTIHLGNAQGEDTRNGTLLEN
jgi:hypothetical protein